MPDNILPLSLLCLAAYLLGSVPFGIVFAKFFCGKDPRKEGSKNIGATNVARLCGIHFGIATLLCDALKGLLPAYYALHIAGFSTTQAAIVGFCALLGHMFSVFLGFKGGKAVATTIGVFIPLSFTALLISALLCVATIVLTRFVSLGSLVLALSLPVCLAIMGRFDILPVAIVVALAIFIKHRENIKRLLSGKEKKLGQRS